MLFCCVDEETCKKDLKELGVDLPKALAKAISDIALGKFI